MKDKQSTNKIFMVEPEVFFMNPQTASSNHYQLDDKYENSNQILDSAIQEFKTTEDESLGTKLRGPCEEEKREEFKTCARGDENVG